MGLHQKRRLQCLSLWLNYEFLWYLCCQLLSKSRDSQLRSVNKVLQSHSLLGSAIKRNPFAMFSRTFDIHSYYFAGWTAYPFLTIRWLEALSRTFLVAQNRRSHDLLSTSWHEYKTLMTKTITYSSGNARWKNRKLKRGCCKRENTS